MGLVVGWIGNRHTPVRIFALNLTGDEPPTTAGELDVFVIRFHLPFAILIEFLPSEELVRGNEHRELDWQGERIRTVEVLAVRSYHIERLGIAGVDEGTVEDVAGFIGAGALESLVKRLTNGRWQCNRVGLDAWHLGELIHRERFDLGCAEVVGQGESDDGSLIGAFDEKAFVLAAVLGELHKLVIRDEHNHGRAFGWLFESQGDKAVEISPGEGDPAVGRAFDFDVMQDGQGGFWVDQFAKSCQSGFQFRHGECDGIHSGGGLNAKSPCTG